MSDDNQFQPHDLEWTPDKIARFWDFENQNEAKRGIYFTLRFGMALVRMVRERSVLAEPVLDYGAGGGDLVEQLVGEGIRSWACDYSPASVASLQARLADRPAFERGVLIQNLPSDLPAETFGTVFLVETLEHLPEEWRVRTLAEIMRVLRPGGCLVASVPNAERLEESKVLCADCGAIFHRVQHIASFDASALTNVMAQAGFTRLHCEAVNLWKWTDDARRHDRTLRARLRRGLERMGISGSRSAATPHLVYIGRKAEGPR